LVYNRYFFFKKDFSFSLTLFYRILIGLKQPPLGARGILAFSSLLISTIMTEGLGPPPSHMERRGSFFRFKRSTPAVRHPPRTAARYPANNCGWSGVRPDIDAGCMSDFLLPLPVDSPTHQTNRPAFSFTGNWQIYVSLTFSRQQTAPWALCVPNSCLPSPQNSLRSQLAETRESQTPYSPWTVMEFPTIINVSFPGSRIFPFSGFYPRFFPFFLWDTSSKFLSCWPPSLQPPIENASQNSRPFSAP